MQLFHAVDEYLTHCRGKNLSTHTQCWYEHKLRFFLAWAGKEGITQLEDVRPAVVYRFTDHLRTTRGYDTHRGAGTSERAAQTVKGYVQVVKGFLTWAANEDLISPRMPARIELPKVEEKVIQTLTPAMYRALGIAAGNEHLVWLTHRDRAILAVLLDTGIRANELCTLRMERIDLRAGCLLVDGKGRKQREVGPLGEESTAALKRYLTRYRPHTDCPAAFLSRFHKPLTPTGLDEVLYRLKRWAGGPETFGEVDVRAHVFRHSYACGYLAAGGDVYALSRLLGHSSVTVTERYLRAYQQRAARQGKSVLDGLAGVS